MLPKRVTLQDIEIGEQAFLSFRLDSFGYTKEELYNNATVTVLMLDGTKRYHRELCSQDFPEQIYQSAVKEINNSSADGYNVQ